MKEDDEDSKSVEVVRDRVWAHGRTTTTTTKKASTKGFLKQGGAHHNKLC